MEVFKELKVVELAAVLAGPAVGLFFAELGAEVIKIENSRGGGDLTRKWKLPVENPASRTSAYYHAVNWNKKVVFLDIKQEEGRIQVHDFIRTADVLIVNFKKGDAQKYGLHFSALHARYPFLIVAEITGFDDDDRLAYDAVLQAESGLMALNAGPGQPAMKLPVAFIDLLAAHQLKEGILIALMQRAQTGKGKRVSVSLYRAAIASLANQASAYLNTGIVPQSVGSLHPTIAPYGEVFYCSDRKPVLLAVGTDDQFVRLCEILDSVALSEDPRFCRNEFRVVHREALALHLKERISVFTSGDFLEKCHARKVPAAAILNLGEVFENPAAANMILSQTEEDGTCSKRVATVAFKLEDI